MSDREQNERLMRDLVDVFWNQQRLDSYDDFFTPDFKIHTGTADYSGKSGMCDGFAGPFFEGFPDLRHEVEFLLIDGDWTALRYHGTGTLTGSYEGLQGSGQKLDYHGTVVLELKDGRIAEAWGHSDLADWVAAHR
ncbi:MAG: hypothetical protein CMM46_03230 [Rhodospirillaceae bacterium]|nr:hypothetical protein [Rhodospirillaceae bacterium]|tara:strand:+ start:2782 stop:3189 length:408 start_codon:yes stop_codon:yes gene_type:complete